MACGVIRLDRVHWLFLVLGGDLLVMCSGFYPYNSVFVVGMLFLSKNKKNGYVKGT